MVPAVPALVTGSEDACSLLGALGFLELVGALLCWQRVEGSDWCRFADHWVPRHPSVFSINQTSKDQTQRVNIKSSKGKATNNTQGDSYKDDS